VTLAEYLENAPEFKDSIAVQPLRAKVLLAMARRMDAAQERLTRADFHDFVRLAKEIAELGSWLGRTQDLPSQSQIENSFKANVAAGWPLGLAFDYRDLQRKKSRGRPMKNRNLALQALDLKETRPRYSWMQIAILLCPCEKKHDPTCKERIRQQALMLRKTLAALGV